ncbi:YgaP family membrane protein [Marinifilum caeruleilacunae]|uniref:DUF2892 domain-containing protein n=1 Tax=Marinifilum caeruleilacunae TaxID=2499076 RepID=A0ABX1WSV0_9BACT|nr:DUF2892 domain-containing protein [Marinifilum caeruleilacunae]NOU58999.1 DUF2892 domain-containing protein [Marinifilum caeruleilacunae]
MKKNMGTLDRVLRVIVSVTLAILYFTDIITGTLGLIVFIFACVMFLTSLVGNCPPYTLMGINTCKVKPKEQ